MPSHPPKIALLGATGAVGEEVLRCMHDVKIEFDEIKLLASARSAGTEVVTPFGVQTVEEVTEKSFENVAYAIFCAGGSVSKKWAPIANVAGCIVIDNSSAFRYEADVPLVIPQINGDTAVGAPLIANPNCTTAIAAMALYPLYKVFGLQRVLISTYQSASGAGAAGMQELIDGARASLDDADMHNEIFAHPLPFNVIPRIDALQENGYTKEEMKVAWETQKIFGDNSIAISCTAVRVPVLRSHSEAIVIETEKPITAEAARSVLEDASGVEVRDDPENDVYPMPLTASNKWAVEVGRIRRNLVFGEHGIEFFVSGDQLLRGAALNAVEILQHIINN